MSSPDNSDFRHLSPLCLHYLFSILFNDEVAALYAGGYAGAPDNQVNPFVVPEKKLLGRCIKEINEEGVLSAHDHEVVVQDTSLGLVIHHDLFCPYQQRLR